jgi:hypothetical protein
MRRNIARVWLTDKAVYICQEDGQMAYELFADYPRLAQATRKEREEYVADEDGIHWPALDEDLSYDGFFLPKQTTALYDIFMAHPELNASAIARRMGITQSLFAQYISGAKQPSRQRMSEILATMRTIGSELMAIPELLPA